MRRRALLASLCTGVVGLAVCSNSDEPSSGRSSPTDTWTFWPTTVDRETGPGSDLAVEPGPVEAPDLEWSVEMLSTRTADRPGRLRIAVENTGEARPLTASGELPFPITPGMLTDGDARAWPALVPVDADYERRFDGTCWRAPVDDPFVADDAPWDWGHGKAESRTLAAGERIEDTYHFLSSEASSCFEPGDYQFGRHYRLDGQKYEWTFTVRVPSAGGDA